MVLHRENIPALNFIKEGLVMFSAQAKEKGVTLELATNNDVYETSAKILEAFPLAIPLRENDVFSCDRFKMDQVRTLTLALTLTLILIPTSR